MEVGSVFLGQNINMSTLTDILSRISVGDMVRAQILEFTASDLVLKLFDGTTLTAATTSEIDAKQGEFMDFIVKNKSENQLILEPAKKAVTKQLVDTDAELKKQLLAMDFKADAANVEIASEIKASNLTLNKENFVKVLDMLVKFKDLTPSKAVFMASSDIEAHEKNINSLNKLVEGKLNISSDIDDLMKALSAAGDLDSSDSEALIAKDQPKAVVTSEKPDNQAINQKTLQNELQKMGDQRLQAIFKDSAQLEKLSNLFNSNKNIPEQFQKDIEAFVSSEFKNLPAEDQKQINDLLNKLAARLKGNSHVNEESNVNDGKGHKPESIKELHKALEGIFVKLDSRTPEKDLNISKVYKEMLDKLETAREFLAQSNLAGKAELLGKIDNISENLKFLNEINNNNTYVQIPINMGNTNTTGELYILKRDSKKKKINPENVTMFISLNTQNIGQVESLIGINKKNVSVNMRLEDQGIINFIKENYKDLYNGLSEKGYKLVDLKYKLISEPANITNVNKIATTQLNQNRVSIDYRL